MNKSVFGNTVMLQDIRYLSKPLTRLPLLSCQLFYSIREPGKENNGFVFLLLNTYNHV